MARSRLARTGVDLQTQALLVWADGAQAELDVAMDRRPAQWLVVTGERGEIEVRGEPYTARDAPSELWVSGGTGTKRVPVPTADPYRLMVEEVSSVLAGGPGWVLPLAEARQTAVVLDAARTSARSGGEPVAPPALPVAA